MSTSRNLSKLGSNTNSSGILQPAGGGTGVTTSTGSGAVTLNTDPYFTGNVYITGDGVFGSGDGPTIGGLTNPIVAQIGNSNNYVQSYIVNYSLGTQSSADIICYPSNGGDASGWIDMGITGNNYNQAAYSVTGPNEGYLFMSAPGGSSTSGNLVIATDSTGTYNAIQFYAGGFNQAKAVYGLQLTATTVDIATSAVAKTITIGNATGATKIVANTGTGGFQFNTPATGYVAQYATAAPTVDMFNISNVGFPVATAGVSSIQIQYYGANSAIESSANRVDIYPGNSVNGLWNAYRVAPAYGAWPGVTQNAFKANTIVAGGGTDNVLYVGTGWDNIVNYNGTSIINGLGQHVTANLTNTLQSTQPPLLIFPNTAISSAVAGGIEYDSKKFLATPATGNAAVIQALHYYRTNAAITLANSSSAQAWTGVGVALQANTTYEFEGQFNLSTSGTISHTESHLFAYTGSVSAVGYQINRFNNATTGVGANSVYASAITAAAVTPAITVAQAATYQIKGILVTNTAGRLTPQIQFSATPGGTSTVASLAYFKIAAIDYGNANTVIGNWA